jgi:cell division protein FtsL
VLAEKRKEVYSPIYRAPEHTRKKSLLSVAHSTMILVCLVCLASCFFACLHIRAYARATETGYKKSDLLSELRALRIENEKLRLEIDEHRRPTEIEAFAIERGMQQVNPVAYLEYKEKESQIAQGLESGNPR